MSCNGSWEERVDQLIGVLKKLKDAGLRINPRKAKLFQPSVVFLGLLIHRGAIHIPKERVKNFVEYPTPSNRLELRRFINSMGFFRNSIPHYAELSYELIDLVTNSDPTKKGHVRFKFTDHHRTLFRSMQRAAERYLPLYEIDPNKPLYAFSDASKKSVSFVAFQLEGPDSNPGFGEGEVDTSGKDDRTGALMNKIFGEQGPAKRFAFCFSRKLTPPETRYSIFKLELLGCVAGLQVARDLLLFRPIILFVDSKSLMYIRLCRNASEQIARLSVQLSSFEVELYHVPSSLNLSDNFTRLREEEADPAVEKDMRSLTEKEAHEIVKRLIIPNNFHLPSELLNGLLNQDGVLVDLPGKRKRKTVTCKEIPRKTTCPTIQGPRKLKDFTVEIGGTPNFHTCNMMQETYEEEENPDGDSDFHGWDIQENNNNDTIDITNDQLEVEETPENPPEGTFQNSYNTLQDLTMSAKIFEDGLISKDDFRRAQENDIGISEAIQAARLSVTEVDGILCVKGRRRHGASPQPLPRPVLPEGLLRWYAISMHLDPSSFHCSSAQTLRRIKQQFYLLNEAAVREEIGRCYICHIATPNQSARHAFALQKLPDIPRTHISFDICCGLPDDSSNFKYIFCAVDQFSNYTIAAAAKNRSIPEIVNFFRLALFAYGKPQVILLDGEGGLLNSPIFENFLNLYGIKKQRTSIAMPESNGLSERTNFFIKKSLRCLALTQKGNWSDFVPYVVSSINNSVMSYSASPNQLTFGRNDPHAADLITLKRDLSNIDEYIKELLPYVEQIRKVHRARKIDRIHRNLRYINRSRRTKTFNPGDLVLIQNLKLAANRVGRSTYRPATVLDITKSKSCALVQALGSNRVLKYHFTYIKPLIRPLFNKLPNEWQRQVLQATQGRLRELPSQEMDVSSQEGSQETEEIEESLQ